MPWDMNNYPESMKNLVGPIKEKAIEIANRLTEEGYEEGRAISIGIAQAKKWVGEQTLPQHVVPHSDGWAIKREDSERASYVYETQKEALKKAQSIASNQKTRLIIHRQDGSIERQQNFVH
ncbi:DUF2188 domain-containing protein [Evansella sp. AB-P1]|uniref:DUF2188 domain-containing protein n=1 Tax=Evansella sp. AB-P1 TaxID=3037653 RepID=UPI00241D8093|nr:DUF2188 domain-containing protein [Evansella sp. AB-P1]MDG5788826.1 DUF2188 domain-containing protein [Evansella sp. AB-P1]